MRKLLIIFIITLSFSNAGEFEPYVSPGIRLGYTFDKGLTFSFKVSIGVFNKSFTNLTYGYKFPLFSDAQTPERNHFFELQHGAAPKDVGLLVGGGMGFFIYEKNNHSKYGFKSSVFAGLFWFPGFEFETISLDDVQTNFGVEGVLPIPFEGWPTL